MIPAFGAQTLKFSEKSAEIRTKFKSNKIWIYKEIKNIYISHVTQCLKKFKQ